MAKPPRKTIITCAVTGAIHTPSMSPHLPVTATEIAEAALGAAEAGATTFLAPTANCEELAGRVPEGLTVYPVDTLGQARDIVEAVARGETPAAARTCG